MAEFQPGNHQLLWSALSGGFIVYLTLLSGTAEAQLTTFSIQPSNFFMFLTNESDTYTRSLVKPTFTCTVRGADFQYANITRTLLDHKGNLNMSSKQVVMFMESKDATSAKVDKWRVGPGFRENKTRYIPSGKLSYTTGQYSGHIKLNLDYLTCSDQAYYACEVSYNDKSKDKPSPMLMYKKGGDYLYVHPFGLRMEWIEPPSSETELKNGTNVKVKCIGNVGTLNVGGGPVQLVWTYIPHNKTSEGMWLEGREWAKALEYGPEKEIYTEDGAFCTMQQEVTLSFTVIDKRDSNRVYRCAVKRVLASRKVEYTTFSDANKQSIKVPDFYPPPKEKTIGTRGFLGAVAATIAFMVITTFGGIWYVRVQAKKKARAAELEKRKDDIDTRRKSIINIVEARRNLKADATSAAPSTAPETSDVTTDATSDATSTAPSTTQA